MDRFIFTRSITRIPLPNAFGNLNRLISANPTHLVRIILYPMHPCTYSLPISHVYTCIPTADMMCSILNDSILVTPVCDVDAQEFRKPGDSSVEFLSVFLSTSVLCKCHIFLETIVEHVRITE